MPRVILFLCIANSARSQMAEGLARALFGDGAEVHSAGSAPSILNPLAKRVLDERGLDTKGHFSKGIADVPLGRVDTVITLCEEEICPSLPEGARHLHWPMPDPAGATGSEADRLEAFRSVAVRIEERLRDWWPNPGQRSSAIA